MLFGTGEILYLSLKGFFAYTILHYAIFADNSLFTDNFPVSKLLDTRFLEYLYYSPV